ncbi:MAG: hypothetical protein AAFY28_07570 [Actinomycetota bacterium]
MTLAKAEIEAIDENGRVGDTIEVQFNPASMQLQYANSTDGGTSRPRQNQQYNGSGSTTLSFDIEFDTADLDDGGQPVDVRKETMKISQFVLPGGTKSKTPPPRANFRWGTFELMGVVTSLTEDLSFFSTSGVPLRAKLSVQIKEQDARYEAQPAEPAEAPPAGEDDGGADGGSGAVDSAADALDGETPSDFLARNGLAPEAWRALGGALDALADGVELEAGVAIGFDSTLSLGAGVGITSGVQAGLDLDADIEIGLGAGSGGRSGRSSPARALSAAGGVTAAIERSAVGATEAAAAAARASFGAPTSSGTTSGTAAPPTSTPSAEAVSSRAPLAAGGSGHVTPATASPPRERPPQADRRAMTFGRGVPLRERPIVAESSSDRYVVLGRPETPTVDDRPGRTSVAPWTQLPAGSDRATADRREAEHTSPCACRTCDPRGRRH